MENIRQPLALIGVLLLGVVLLSNVAETQRRAVQEEKIGDGVLMTVLPKDAIPAIFNPEFVSGSEADAQMRDNEPVLGIVDPVTGEAKAYSLWQLDRHEIVNDRLGGKPVAVTW